jgi:hypothetical protein
MAKATIKTTAHTKAIATEGRSRHDTIDLGDTVA